MAKISSKGYEKTGNSNMKICILGMQKYHMIGKSFIAFVQNWNSE